MLYIYVFVLFYVRIFVFYVYICVIDVYTQSCKQTRQTSTKKLREGPVADHSKNTFGSVKVVKSKVNVLNTPRAVDKLFFTFFTQVCSVSWYTCLSGYAVISLWIYGVGGVCTATPGAPVVTATTVKTEAREHWYWRSS